MNPYMQFLQRRGFGSMKSIAPSNAFGPLAQIPQQPTMNTMRPTMGSLPGVPQQQTDQPTPQPSQQLGQNPYLAFLQQRAGIFMQPQQQSQSQQPGYQAGVLSGSYNAKNTVIPNYSQIKSDLALDPDKQQKGTIIS